MPDAVLAVGRAVDEMGEHIRDANSQRRPLRVAGAGTWGGAPPIDATDEISTTALNEIIEYVPGDLTITVGAGVTLDAIEQVTAPNRQWLTLDPFGSPQGTIGATIATASAGPLATGFGTPRDLVLGIEAVSGTGAVIRAGGRVVKNVAGFDLTRLFTGARGTLGVITAVSLRLRAKPAHDETIAIPVPDKANAIRAMMATIREWPSAPMAAEILSARMTEALDLGDGTTLLLRLGGNRTSMTGMRRKVALLGSASAVDGSVWPRLRTIEDTMPCVARLSDLPSAFAERWADASLLTDPSGLMTGSLLRGHIRCIMPSLDRQQVAAFRSRVPTMTIIFDRLPAAAWSSLTTEPDGQSLQGRIRSAFDPLGLMNPGAMRLTR